MARRNTTRVQIDGLEELLQRMPAFADRVTGAAGQAATTSARHGAAASRGVLPQGPTGQLRRSVTVWPAEQSGARPAAAAVGGMQPYDYTGWVEFGGSRGRPRVARGRYFIPTQRKERPAFRDLAERLTEQEIARFPWPHPRP